MHPEPCLAHKKKCCKLLQFIRKISVEQFFVVVQSLSCVQLFVTPWTAASQASLSFTISQSLLKLMATESVMLSNQLVLCHPLLLHSIFPSISVFSNELALCIRWPNIGASASASVLTMSISAWFSAAGEKKTLKRSIGLSPHFSDPDLLWRLSHSISISVSLSVEYSLSCFLLRSCLSIPESPQL